jgi:hypothetical protein
MFSISYPPLPVAAIGWVILNKRRHKARNDALPFPLFLPCIDALQHDEKHKSEKSQFPGPSIARQRYIVPLRSTPDNVPKRFWLKYRHSRRRIFFAIARAEGQR